MVVSSCHSKTEVSYLEVIYKRNIRTCFQTIVNIVHKYIYSKLSILKNRENNYTISKKQAVIFEKYYFLQSEYSAKFISIINPDALLQATLPFQ